MTGQGRLGGRTAKCAAVLLSFAFAAAAYASPAAAVSEWRPIQTLSVGEQSGEVPQVAIADDGSAIAVWTQNDPGSNKERVRYATRAPGENFSAPQFLSSAERDVRKHVRVKMNKRGDAIVVWESVESDGVVVRSRFRPAGGEFGPEQVVASSVEPEVGIDGEGAATVIYHPDPGDFGDFRDSSIYSSKTRAGTVDATWGDRQDLTDHPKPGPPEFRNHWNETHGSLAVNEAGDRLAVFASQFKPYGSDPERQVLFYAARDKEDPDWSAAKYDDTASPDQEVKSTYARYQRDGGNRVAGWTEGSQLFAFYGLNVQSIGSPLPDPFGAAFGIDSSGDAFGLWSDGSASDGGALRGANAPEYPGAFGPVDSDPVPGNGAGARRRPDEDTDAGDSAMSVFKQFEGAGPEETVQVAARGSGQTKFDTPVTVRRDPNGPVDSAAPNALTPPGFFEDDDSTKEQSGPKVAVNSEGEAVAVWSRNVNGTFRVQTSLYVPIDDPENPPPPPPPPPPEPANPSPIQLAREMQSGKAIVLIANVPGNVNELRWSFGSQNEPPIVGKVVGGQLQRTVRLRLPDISFKASLQVVGPDGTQNYSRSFAAFPNPRHKDARRVLGGLERSKPPPVFAVGDRETLTARSDNCSPTTMWSGQQKFEGCFKPIEGIPDIPQLELGVLPELAKELDLDLNRQLMETATGLTDGYVAEGRTLLNDKFPVTPSAAADVVAFPQAKSLVSANAELPVGGGKFDPSYGFNLRLDPAKQTIPLGKLPNPPKLDSLAGLEIVGDWNVDLDKQEAKIKASVKFPPAFKKAGVQLANEVILRATPERVIVDEVRVGPIDVDVAALKVDKFQIQYKREPNQWDGQGKACIVLACLDMIPPNGGVTIKDGDLAQAGATLVLPPPDVGVPIFTGVNLERIGFGIGLRPTRITGNARVGVGQIIKLDGRIFLAFPDSQNPFVFDRKTAGDAYPGQFYGRTHTRSTFGASAEASVKVPVIGETKLAQAYVLYEFPDYGAFGGSYSADVLDLVSVSGGVDAEVDFDDGLFNIHGSVRACLHIIDDICQGAVGNVSRGRGGSGGAGACVEFLGLNIGGGVQWQRLSEPFIWPFDGCKWSRFRATVREGAVQAKKAGGPRARASATSYTVNVENGKPSPAIQLNGNGKAPTLSVRGPGGQFLQIGEGEGFKRSSDSTIRAMRLESKLAQFAVVGFQKARPGTYTVSTLPGSTPVTGVKQATDPPDAKIKGRVTGRGARKRLRYHVRGRESQKVIFQEVQRNGATQILGSTTRSGPGSLRFKSAPGRGRRKIVAQFELSGIPTERKTVATFKPLSPKLARPKRLRARHRGNTLGVSWRKVSGASRYEVAAALSSRRMVFKTTRRTKARLRVPRYLKGRVTVRALDGDLRQSRHASRRFGGRGKQPSPFRPLLTCRVLKTRIVCSERGSRCGGRTPTISASPGRRTLGTRRSDVIVGSSKADRIDGRGGNDVICTGGGNDRITGGAGNDLLQGQAGKDRITGGAGNDRIDGGAGADRIKGGLGNDRISGGSGNDVVVGGAGRGRDTVNTGSGNDRVETRDRNVRDRVNCGPGRDRARVDRVDGVRGCEQRRLR